MTTGFQCLTTIHYGGQGIGWACADPGAGGRRSGPRQKSHVIWVNLDLNPLPPLKKFPGSAHWDWGWGGGGNWFHWNALVRTDCIMKDQAQGGGGVDSIPAGWKWWLSRGLDNTTRYFNNVCLKLAFWALLFRYFASRKMNVHHITG